MLIRQMQPPETTGVMSLIGVVLLMKPPDATTVIERRAAI